MSDPNAMETAEQQITITRVFDAPRTLVFQAWTDPDHLAAWFGPMGFDTPRDSVEIDLRVGGRLDLRMVHKSSGREHRVSYEIIDLAEPELLVLRSEPMQEAGPIITRIELVEDDGKTRMTLTDGPFPGDAGRHAGAGWESAFDKLDALLAA